MGHLSINWDLPNLVMTNSLPWFFDGPFIEIDGVYPLKW